jgi:hypothetical protein
MQRLVSFRSVSLFTRSMLKCTFTTSRKPNLTVKISEEMVGVDKYSLTPHELWVTQGKNMERPFSGHFWDCDQIGQYSCIVCTTQLFT